MRSNIFFYTRFRHLFKIFLYYLPIEKMSSFVTNEINLRQVAIKKNKIPKMSIRFHPISRYFEHLLQRLSFVLAEKNFAKKNIIR